MFIFLLTGWLISQSGMNLFDFQTKVLFILKTLWKNFEVIFVRSVLSNAIKSLYEVYFCITIGYCKYMPFYNKYEL